MHDAKLLLLCSEFPVKRVGTLANLACCQSNSVNTFSSSMRQHSCGSFRKQRCNIRHATFCALLLAPSSEAFTSTSSSINLQRQQHSLDVGARRTAACSAAPSGHTIRRQRSHRVSGITKMLAAVAPEDRAEFMPPRHEDRFHVHFGAGRLGLGTLPCLMSAFVL